MPNCRYYNEGIARDVDVLGGKTQVYCGINRGTCPYGNEGHKILDENQKEKIICITGGKIEKSSHFKSGADLSSKL